MAKNRIMPRGDELITLLRAEPMLTTKALAERFAVSGEAARMACIATGVVPARHGQPAKLPATSMADMPAMVKAMHDADPHLTAARIMTELGVSQSTAYRLVKLAGIELRNPLRRLPDDTALAAEIKQTGNLAVAERYGVDPNRVSRHAVRLGVVRQGKQIRKLPPDDILAAELAVLKNREIAQRYSCSAQVVIEARRRLEGAQRPRHRLPPSVAAVPLLSTAIAHLHAYRGILAAFDPGKATALLDDIEQLTTVATAIVTITGLVTEPRSLS